jgi:hypothetical protein
LIDRDSMLFWFPTVEELDISKPRTEIVEVGDNFDMIKCIDEGDFPDGLLDGLLEGAKNIGYPLFLRTDQLSGKHRWEKTCYVTSEDVLPNHVYELIEESAMAGFFGLPVKAFAFREFHTLDWRFKAFGGMPVARERRYFIKDGKVLCHHPYWVQGAIDQWWGKVDLPKDWRLTLGELNREDPDEIDALTSYCKAIMEELEGYWSVDFAMEKQGRWFLIDMATGLKSYHPSDCPHCPESQRKLMRHYEGID